MECVSGKLDARNIFDLGEIVALLERAKKRSRGIVATSASESLTISRTVPLARTARFFSTKSAETGEATNRIGLSSGAAIASGAADDNVGFVVGGCHACD